ncbi:MAG: hypothetical protein V9G04_18500 [Nocardioides sp.]
MLTIQELSDYLGIPAVSTLDRFLNTEAQRGVSRGRHGRVVLGQVLDLAVRHDALPRKPVRGTAPLRRSRSEIRSLSLNDLAEVRRILRDHRTGPGIPRPPPDGQLAQIFEVMLGTSARLGEALAVRRQMSTLITSRLWSRSPARSSTSAGRASPASRTPSTPSTADHVDDTR